MGEIIHFFSLADVVKVRAKKAKKLRGIKAKRYNKERFSEKVQLRKKFKAFEEKGTQIAVDRDLIL